jgi:ferric-dicitrate binding protein FerR (iron transport regulator)
MITMAKQTTCETLRDLVSSAPEAVDSLPTELSQHAARCAACQAEVHAAHRLREVLATPLGSRTVDETAGDHAHAHWSTKARPARPGLDWRLALGLGLGAAAAAVVMVVVGAPQETAPGEAPATPAPPAAQADLEAEPGRAPPPAPDRALMAVTDCQKKGASAGACAPAWEYETAPGERLSLVLQDGTTLALNGSSKLRLAREGRSLAVLRGEALLEVVKQAPLPPLDIALPTGRAQVTGTKLHVAAEEGRSLVDVVRGRVIVEGSGERRDVGAGEEALLEPNAPPRVYAAPALGELMRWADDEVDEGAGMLGLGTLTARRPGAKTDPEQALALADHRVEVRIQGRVARTEVEEAFRNDTGDTLEGVYTFPVPAGAQIAALDLRVDGRWEHGAVVEREEGEKIWRGVIRQATPKRERRDIIEYIWVPGPWRDPALLTWKQGSQFELRIFPIPAHGERRVRIAYTETLRPTAGGRRYLYPLAKDPTGKARAELFSLRALVGGVSDAAWLRTAPYKLAMREETGKVELQMRRERFTPEGDLVIDVPDPQPGAELVAYSFRDQSRDDTGFAVVALRPDLPARARDAALDVLFVVDTSYGIQAARLKQATRLVRRMGAELGNAHRVHLVACGTRCREIGPGFQPAGVGWAEEMGTRLGTLEPLGSTSLTRTWEEVAGVLRAHHVDPRTARIVYLGDGLPSMGELDAGRIAAAASRSLGEARLTSVSLGGTVDQAVLEALAAGQGGAYVDFARLGSIRATAMKVLQHQWGEPLTEVAIHWPEGLGEIAPERPGVWWPGEEKLIGAQLRGTVSGEIVVTGKLDGEPWEKRYRLDLVPSESQGNAFVPRLWAERRIQDLERTDAATHHARIVELSKRYHLLTKATSLLVLESPAMARAFKVEDTRPAIDWTGEEEVVAEVGGDIENEAGEGLSTKALSETAAGKITTALPTLGTASRTTMSRMEMDALDPSGGSGRVRRSSHWEAMRKVWYREASIGRGESSSFEERTLAKQEAALAQAPESRNRTRTALQWYLRMGLDRSADRLLERWAEKDRMDAGMLIAAADLASVRGDMARSRELLASAVDVDPTNLAAQERMVRLYQAAEDRGLACEHALTRALLAPESWEPQVEAIRCGGERGRHLERLVRGDLAKAAERLAAEPAAGRSNDSLTLEARWDDDLDLDLLVFDPQGNRVSWQGGAKRVSAQDATRVGHELLAISADKVGRYRVMIVHADAAEIEDRPRPVTGRVTLRAYGETRTLDFTTDGRRAQVGEVQVAAKWRYEPVR